MGLCWLLAREAAWPPGMWWGSCCMTLLTMRWWWALNIPEENELAHEFGTMSSLILRFVSSSWEVDLDDYRALCTWLYFSYHQAIMAQWFRVGKNTKSDFVFWPFLYHIWKLHSKCDSEQLFFCWYINLLPSGNYFLPKKAYFFALKMPIF